MSQKRKKATLSKERSGDKKEPAPSPNRLGTPRAAVAVAIVSLLLGILTPLLLRSKQASQYAWRTRKLDSQRVGAEACSDDQLSRFWTADPLNGYHIFCLDHADFDQMRLTMFKEGLKQSQVNLQLPHRVAWSQLKRVLEDNLGMSYSGSMKQQWAVFSSEGERLFDEQSTEEWDGEFGSIMVDRFGIGLLFSGGQFIWPGVRIGFRRDISLYSIMPPGSPNMRNRNRTVTLETLSLIPLVLSVEGFLSESECEHIQAKAQPTLQYSAVVLMDMDAGRPASDFRTSQTTFLEPDDSILVDIDYRSASLVRIPRSHQEYTQVLRYELGEKYNAHHDYFDPKLYQQDAETLESIGHGRRNRMATVFWYLSTVPKGGETVFPRFNRGQEKSTTDCTTGLKVKPELGKVIVFYSMTPDGLTDPYSLHGACPVREGVKWAANKWIWNEPMPYTPA